MRLVLPGVKIYLRQTPSADHRVGDRGEGGSAGGAYIVMCAMCTGAYPGGSQGGYPSRRGGLGGGMGRVGVGMPGGGMGMPGGRGGGRSRGVEAPQANVAAYKLYPHSAVYKLDGSQSTVQLGDPDQTDATSKVEWAKDGKQLKFSLVGNGGSGQGSGKLQVKDHWKLSEDGRSLRVDRSIKSPEGSGTVHLVFIKK